MKITWLGLAYNVVNITFAKENVIIVSYKNGDEIDVISLSQKEFLQSVFQVRQLPGTAD